MNESMEMLRDKLNAMLISGNASKEEILKVSEELDVFIVEALKNRQGSGLAMNGAKLEELEVLMDKLDIFKKMYQSMRIVDPVRKKVLLLKDYKLLDDNISCCEFWGRKQFCRNCISIRAYNKDEAIFKLEIMEKNIYMITAVPVVIEGKKLVVELLKDVSSSLVLGNSKCSSEKKLYTIIDYMNEVTVKDKLTDLFNRRFIDEKLPSEIFNASEQQEPISVIFADLDHFKEVNDVYGHAVGDQVLIEFAKDVKRAIRKEHDWAARYGGEEFFICLPNTNKITAIQIAER
ncbi:MAG: putative signal transduction protein, partial [Clostridiales bacterium]|nr:putative signal transduction protein [Clostridiales bacterium]